MKLAFALPLVLFVVGCGGKSDQIKTTAVKGKVTLDGIPMATGKIRFDEGPSIPVSELEIKDGAYSGQVTVGKKTVRIIATKVGAPPKGMAGMPGIEEEIPLPAKYNAASTDVREVKEGADNTFDFTVTKK